jgi:2'-5' RNA ligase
VSWPATEHLENHWRWRPEWEPGRVCLYWYLTFDENLPGPSARALRAARRADWLDAVPRRWLHLTVCEVEFADVLADADLRRVVEAGRECAAETGCLRLGFGPAACMEDAVVMPVEPLDPLRHLQQRLRSATERVLGPGQGSGQGTGHVHAQFWPHVSLGYVNRPTSAATAASLLGQLGQVSDEVAVDHLVLAAVDRDRRHYRWRVLEELPLSTRGAATRNPTLPALESADRG